MNPMRLSKNGRYYVELRGLAALQWLWTAIDCPNDSHIREYKTRLLMWARAQTTNPSDRNSAYMHAERGETNVHFLEAGQLGFFYVREGPRIVIFFITQFLRPWSGLPDQHPVM